jgi:hypothetical protein
MFVSGDSWEALSTMYLLDKVSLLHRGGLCLGVWRLAEWQTSPSLRFLEAVEDSTVLQAYERHARCPMCYCTPPWAQTSIETLTWCLRTIDYSQTHSSPLHPTPKPRTYFLIRPVLSARSASLFSHPYPPIFLPNKVQISRNEPSVLLVDRSSFSTHPLPGLACI